MLASSVERGLGARSCMALRAIRDLAPPFALKRNCLAVDLTVSPTCPDDKCSNFSCLSVPETMEWECRAALESGAEGAHFRSNATDSPVRWIVAVS
jgi:hypothetical protein